VDATCRSQESTTPLSPSTVHSFAKRGTEKAPLDWAVTVTPVALSPVAVLKAEVKPPGEHEKQGGGEEGGGAALVRVGWGHGRARDAANVQCATTLPAIPRDPSSYIAS
jgi:hypothetical protein